MKSLWIEHEGKRIFYADYSGFGSDHLALQQEADEAVGVIAGEPDKSVLVLVSFENTDASMSNQSVICKLITRANHVVLKRALGGSAFRDAFYHNHCQCEQRNPNHGV